MFYSVVIFVAYEKTHLCEFGENELLAGYYVWCLLNLLYFILC